MHLPQSLLKVIFNEFCRIKMYLHRHNPSLSVCLFVCLSVCLSVSLSLSLSLSLSQFTSRGLFFFSIQICRQLALSYSWIILFSSLISTQNINPFAILSQHRSSCEILLFSLMQAVLLNPFCSLTISVSNTKAIFQRSYFSVPPPRPPQPRNAPLLSTFLQKLHAVIVVNI